MNTLVEEKKIGENTYTIRKIPGIKARKVLLRLIKIAAPILGGVQSGQTIENVDVGNLISQVLDNLSESEFEALIKELVHEASVYTDSGLTLALSENETQNDLWTGNLFEMFEFLIWVLEVNFGGFISGLQAKVKTRKIESGATKTGKRRG